MVKISFLGDIMCERPFLKAAHQKSGYNFSGFLSPCASLFKGSDYIIGNLETPCDFTSGVTKDMFVFNAPIELLQSLKASGIDFVTTATNHCLDRGSSGLKNSIKAMEDIGISHTGTFISPADKRYSVIKFADGTKIAVLSYTYGTNYMDNKVVISENEFYLVNYLTPPYSGRNKAYDEMNYSLRAKLTRMIPRGLRIRINSILGRSFDLSFTDKIQEGDIVQECLKEIAETIQMAKTEADLVFLCPHFGGQFNTAPGSYVKTFTEFFQNHNVDVMVGNHPHVAQKVERVKKNMIAAYSLGNISMSLSTPYVVRDNLPDYSIMLHIYVDNKKITKIGFSILVEREHNGFITVVPLHKLYEDSARQERLDLEKNCTIICNRILGTKNEFVSISDEYAIEV